LYHSICVYIHRLLKRDETVLSQKLCWVHTDIVDYMRQRVSGRR